MTLLSPNSPSAPRPIPHKLSARRRRPKDCNKPFKEWVNVSFDPTKTSEDKLLALLKKHRCPKATLDRDDDKLTAIPATPM